ncbi:MULTISPECIES: glycoside hydrolase family 88 protein [Prevotellaceae]|uniref:glycoside hydrolase family 88 protein n=1 Tax=Prevotellaceae TaxID=171552 RepID=UPI0023EBDFDD|nr:MULTISPECIES: glycoside hydrolase family 88 protein [Prevotellaceae]MDF4241649.1 glycoside hydrolase family 88 protein [Prevotella sp. B2-R-102]
MKHKTLTFRFLDMSLGGFARLFLLLLLPCLSVIGVKADSNGGVKFNSGVRYSQWAINSRLHDFYGNQKKFGFDYYDNNGNNTSTVTWLKDDGTTYQRTFDYVAGLVGKASLEAADFYENFDWSKPWFYAAQGYATGTPYANTKMTLDNMNAAKMYFPILAGKLKSQKATTVANTAIKAVIEHMKTYNSTYVIGSGKNALNSTNANDVQKSMFGGWFHKSTEYTDQMWCDGQYMGPALLAQIINHTNKTNNISDNDNDWDIIAKQFSITWAQLYDKNTGLLYHGFTANPGDDASKSWAGISKEKGIYHSASFWGRANAWYFLALVDILEVMPTDNTYYDTFKGYLTNLAAGIAKYQDKDTGCWYQVMDKVPASLTGNYLEASCSSIFTAGYLKAIRLGLLDKATYEPIAKKAYEGLVNQFMVYDNKDNSTIQLVHSCTSAGLGGSSNRAGDDNYYLTGKDASVVTSSDPTSTYYYTEGKVLGGFIMAATEYERAYQNQNQDSKQILFARDLAPNYDFTTTTEGTLDATAYGNGTVTYQWYKNKAIITNATSATYTPTESGSYYCEATANGNTTIKTSETTVTAKSANTDGDQTPSTGSKKAEFDITAFGGFGNSGNKVDNSVTITANNVTVTAIKDVVAYGSTKGCRVNGTGSFKVTAPNNAKITKIICTTDKSSIQLTPNVTSDKTGIISKDITFDYSKAKPNSVTFTAGSTNIYVTKLVVEYETTGSTTPATDLTATYTEGTKSVVAKEEAFTTPILTVKAGETTLEEGTDYRVTYASSNTNAVSVSADGKTLTSVNKGESATITATITPVDKSKYNATIAQFTISVTGRQLVPAFFSASVSANEGDEARVLPTLTVKDKISGQDMTDYTVKYTSGNENIAKVVDGKLTFVGIGKTTIKATITPNKETIYDGCTCSFDVSIAKKEDVNPSETTVVYDFLKNIGEQETTNSSITIGTSIMLGTNFKQGQNKYITITPAGDGGFHAGDIVTIKGYCPKATSGILLYANLTDDEPQYQSPAFPATEKEYTFTVQADCDALYLGRFGGSTTYITSLKITRPGVTGNKTRLTAAFAKHSEVVINKTDNYTMSLPQLIVKAGGNAFSTYTVAYTSNDEDIASVATNGEITIKSTGTVTILATITPTDKDNYEGCTATYTITVKNATPLIITTNDVNINATDAQIKQPDIKVYGDNDKLLTLGTDYTLSFTIDGSNVIENNGVFTVTGDPYKWTEGTSTITVTAKPIGTHSELFTESTFTFTYNVVKGKLTPAFLSNFATETIKVKYDKTKNKSFTVPLIYDGEDVSEYFKYTYYIDEQEATKVNTNNKVEGNKLTMLRNLSEGVHTIKVTANPKTSNKEQDNYDDVYNAPAAITFTINVSANYIIPIVNFNPANVTMYTGTTEGAPDILVTTDGTNKIEESTYTTKWVSFTPSFVKVDMTTGKLEAVNEGTGSVRVTVKGEKLETTTAFLTVYVDDPALYRAKEKENDGTVVSYGNQKIMWNQDKTMEVTLGGWMFPTEKVPTPDYSDEGLSSTYQWANTATQPKWKMAGFDRYVSGEKSRNARQENGSNAMPNSTQISKADFKTNVKTIRDKMFNVPCSGSYLVFNPATTGTVTVHIFQNGAFDSGVYRPQRRVFVMDEEGNFVQSTASIANANGKPTGGIKPVSSYMWDLNPKGKDTAPTIDQVRNHFKNLPTDFDMTPEKFQNNIYESDLTKDVAPNDAYDEKVPGSNGWCVLADSPVTYTFSVKPGKTYYLYNFGSKIGFYGFSFDEDKTKPVEDVVSYDDNTTNTIKTTEAGHVAKVTVNRKMTAGVWTTCVLPFSLNVHQVDAIFGDTYKSGNVNGTQILYFDRVENGKVYFVRHAYNTIVANKPFLIKPSQNVESISTAAAEEYPYVTIEATKNENGKPDDWCTGNGYTWASSYSNDMTVQEGDGFISKDGLFKNFVGQNGTLKGFRGYLKRTETQTGAKPIMLQVVNSSNVDGDNGETTGIEDLIIDADGQLMPANGKVYNINGQLVSEDANSFQSLPSGIYIINGKKYIK